MTAITNRCRPFQQLIRWHVVEDFLRIKLGSYDRSDAEFHKRKLRRAMRICPHRDPTSFFPGYGEQINTEILPIGIAINFNGLVELRREGKNSGPICSQAKTEIVNTPARMTQNVNGRVAQGVEIALCLVLLPPQSRMKTAKYKVKSLSSAG
jgi:hypothetical protein